VTFSPGTPNAETQTLQAPAGTLVDVAPTPRPPSEAISAAGAPLGEERETRTAPSRQARYETVRPFAPAIPIVSGALVIAAAIAAVPLESHAISLREDLSIAAAKSGVIAPSDRQRFDTSRTLAYTALGSAIGLGAMTTGLVAWYILGASKRETFVSISLSPEPNGASIAVRTRL